MEPAEAAQALVRLEEPWQCLFENCSLSMAVADTAGHYVITNAAFRRILHIEEDTQRVFLRDLIQQKEHPEILSALAKKEGGSLQFDKRYQRRDGAVTWLKVCISLTHETQTMPSFLLILADDISDEKNTEETLRENETRLRAIFELNNRVTSELDLRQLFGSLTASLRDLVQCELFALLIPDSEPQGLQVYSMRFREGKPYIDEDIFRPEEVPRSSDFFPMKPTVYQGTPPWLPAHEQELLQRQGLKSGCLLPLMRGSTTVAALGFARSTENGVTESELDLLRQAANQAAIAVGNALLFRRLNESLKRLQGERHYLKGEIRRERDLHEIVGQSQSWKHVLEQAEKVASTDTAVLLLGETGTGKELIAHEIHKRSLRRNHTFVRVDCASIPAGLLESELFGHEMGAFTGAVARNIGRIELANKGTLFLDEVGDIPLEVQSKLLRVLQNRELERLGSTRTMHVDFRLIAATNRDLMHLVRGGEFRRDFYYRVNVYPIQLPPLRERVEDIPMLARHFVKKYAHRMNKSIDMVREQDMDALMHHSWPGNVRELQNIIERSVVGSSQNVLELARLTEAPRVQEPPSEEIPTLQDAERQHVLKALEQSDWVIGGEHGAAHRLGVRRTTLLYKMRRLGITRPNQ